MRALAPPPAHRSRPLLHPRAARVALLVPSFHSRPPVEEEANPFGSLLSNPSDTSSYPLGSLPSRRYSIHRPSVGMTAQLPSLPAVLRRRRSLLVSDGRLPLPPDSQTFGRVSQ